MFQLACTDLGCIVVIGRARCGGSVDLLADMWRAPDLPAFHCYMQPNVLSYVLLYELSMLSYALLIFR
jgi:hypothetical protein